MTSARNGIHRPNSTVRYRLDSHVGGAPGSGLPERHYSGRLFVAMTVLFLLVLWGSLYLWFRSWRAGYRERAAFGAKIVGPAVDPLLQKAPPGVDPKLWSQAVVDTHAMLDRITASGLLDRPQMQQLQSDVAARVARTQPETATLEMIHLWTDLRLRAGPVLSEVPYPALLEFSSTLDPVAGHNPRGISAEVWSDAIDQTRLMLVAVRASDRLEATRRQEFQNALTERLAKAQPSTLRAAVSAMWDDAQAAAPQVVSQAARPAIFTRRANP